MKTINKLKVFLKDLDGITKNTLQFFFGSNLCTHAELNQQEQHAELLILDYDRGINNDAIQNLMNNKQYAIVLHLGNEDAFCSNNIYWLQKPIQPGQLKKCIVEIYEKFNKKNQFYNNKVSDEATTITNAIRNTKAENHSHLFSAVHEETDHDKQSRYKSHKFVGSNHDINPNNASDLSLIYLTPNKYLFHHLAKSVRIGKLKQSNVEITTSFGRILYNLKEGQFHFDFEQDTLKNKMANPLFTRTVIDLVGSIKDMPLKNHHIIGANKFIWESAILASKGRIPIGSNVLNNVNMSSWPNLSELTIFRYAIKIIAAWSKHRMSMIDTATHLNIPQRYVFTVFCAMQAVNHANIGKNVSSFELNQPTKKKSIFAKILSHIFNK